MTNMSWFYPLRMTEHTSTLTMIFGLTTKSFCPPTWICFFMTLKLLKRQMSRPLLFVRRLKSTSSQKYLDMKHKITKPAVWLLCVSKYSHTRCWNALERPQQRFLETIWPGAYTNSLCSSADLFLQGVGKQLLVILRPNKSSLFGTSVRFFPVPSLASPLILIRYWHQSFLLQPFLSFLLFSSFFYIYFRTKRSSAVPNLHFWTSQFYVMYFLTNWNQGINVTLTNIWPGETKQLRSNVYHVLFTM